MPRKSLEMREGADVGFLHHVLGLAIVAQDAAGEPVEPAVMGLDDGAHGRLVAGERTPDELGVGGAGGDGLGDGDAWHGSLAFSKSE